MSMSGEGKRGPSDEMGERRTPADGGGIHRRPATKGEVFGPSTPTACSHSTRFLNGYVPSRIHGGNPLRRAGTQVQNSGHCPRFVPSAPLVAGGLRARAAFGRRPPPAGGLVIHLPSFLPNGLYGLLGFKGTIWYFASSLPAPPVLPSLPPEKKHVSSSSV